MSNTKISIDEVKRLALLSDLDFTEEELNSFIKLATLREDEAKESSPQEEILMNSPKTKKGSFCVPKMLD